MYKVKVEIAEDGSAKFTRVQDGTVISETRELEFLVSKKLREARQMGWVLDIRSSTEHSFASLTPPPEIPAWHKEMHEERE